MINPPFKTKIETQSGFNFADIVSFVSFIRGIRLEDHKFKAKVMGKVKDANAYVVNVLGLNMFYPTEAYDRRRDYIISLKKKYGYPIRQIELAWGSFSGSLNEFIIPEHELKKVDE